MNNQKGFSSIVITLVILALAGIGGASYYFINQQSPEQTTCGTETRVCSDGSLVGRIGPNCEFASCPEVVDETADWKTYTNEKYNYQIKYPGDTYTTENIVSDPQKEITDNNVTLYDIKSVQETKECNCGEYLAIFINAYPNPQALSLEDYVKENIKRWAPDYPNHFINKQTSLNGIPARKVGTEREQYYVFKKDNVIFSIGGFLDMDVIGTFKFTDTTQNQSNNALFVYLTDQKYQGNLGGRSGADAKCSIPAGLSCKPGSNHALITVDTDDSIINMAQNYNLDSNIPVYWYNRDNQTVISLANNWLEMIDDDILHDQEEGTGKGEWSGDFPWTGGKGDNSNGDYNTCNKWTTNEGDRTTGAGPYGVIGGTDKTSWLASDGWAGISFSETCDNERYLRCICEGEIGNK